MDEVESAKDGWKSIRALPHVVPSMLSMKYNLQGSVGSASYACASSTATIGEAYRLIKHGYQDFIIAGGADYNLSRMALSGLDYMRASSGFFNDTPELASRPFDE